MQLAENWRNLDPEVSINANKKVNTAIPDNNARGIESSINITQKLYIESVEVILNADDHPYWV